MIRITVKNELEHITSRLKLLTQPGVFNAPVEKAAWRARTGLIEMTPRRYTGTTRRSWVIKKTGAGTFAVRNESKVMTFLEFGTGRNTGGYIYPKRKKVLFIPLNQAATFGWNSSLTPGIDYILRRRVRGIRALAIVSRYQTTANAILKEEMIKFLREMTKPKI